MLTDRKKAFIEHYVLTKNGAESARLSGYSAKTARQAASRLLTDPDVKSALEAIEAEKREKFEKKKAQLSKESFVETALRKFEEVEEQSIKPRYLEIAGRALGYLTKDDSEKRPNQTLIVNVDSATLSADDKLARLRTLLDSQ